MTLWVLLSILCYASVFISPTIFWPAVFTSYAIPGVLIINFILLLTLPFIRRRLVIFPITALLIGSPFIIISYSNSGDKASKPHDLSILSFNTKFFRILKQFAPYGPANMTPVFLTEDLKDTGYGKCVGEDKTHLRLTATQTEANSIVCIGFRMGDKIDIIKDKKPFKAVYSIDENEWQGQVSLQLKLRDIKE